MRGYNAFLKKEFMESLRSYKLIILPAVFLLLGMMNPLTAKLTPLLMENLVPSGMTIEIGDPTALDSWMQFYKNVPQMGLAIMIIFFSGLMSREYSRGSLVIMLTRGLSRPAVILSKFTAAFTLWTGSYALCLCISWGYTAYFWSGKGLENLLFAAFCLWVFGVLILGFMILGGAVFTTTYGNLLFTAGLIIIQFIVSIIPEAYKYNPLSLGSKNLDLIKGEMTTEDMLWPLIIAGLLTIICIFAAIAVFNKKKL